MEHENALADGHMRTRLWWVILSRRLAVGLMLMPLAAAGAKTRKPGHLEDYAPPGISQLPALGEHLV